jgi:chromosome segregation ATPase
MNLSQSDDDKEWKEINKKIEENDRLMKQNRQLIKTSHKKIKKNQYLIEKNIEIINKNDKIYEDNENLIKVNEQLIKELDIIISIQDNDQCKIVTYYTQKIKELDAAIADIQNIKKSTEKDIQRLQNVLAESRCNFY